MKRNLLVCFSLFTFLVTSFAQSNGDYRSKQTGNWSDKTSWETYSGGGWTAASKAPDNTDGIITIKNSHTITVSSATADQVVVEFGGELVIIALTLADGAGTDLQCDGTVTLNGTLSGTGDISINKFMDWKGGSLSNLVVVAATGRLTITGSDKSFSGIINNQGTISWTSSNLTVVGGIINNFGSFLNGGDVSLNSTSATSQFNNSGSFEKNVGSGSGYSGFKIAIQNTGLFKISNGTFINSLDFTNNGEINVGANAVLQNEYYLYLNNLTKLSGAGTIRLYNNNCVLNSIVRIETGLTVEFDNGLISKTGIGEFSVYGGVFIWKGGTMAANLWVDNGSKAIFSGGDLTLVNNAKINNDGLIKWISGNIFLNGTSIVNTSGTFLDSTNADFTIGSGAGSIGSFKMFGPRSIDYPIYKKVTNTTTTFGNLVFTNGLGGNYNNCNLQIDNGTLFLASSNSNLIDSALITIGPNGILENKNGVMQFGPGAAIAGSGLLRTNASTEINLALVIPNSVSFEVNGGVVSGTGSVNVSQLNLNAGTWNIPTTIPADGKATFTSSGDKTIGKLFINNGKCVWDGGPIHSNSWTLENYGTFDIKTDGTLSNSGGASTINNYFSFKKDSGVGKTSIGNINFHNYSDFSVETGTIQHGSGGGMFDNRGPINIFEGSTLETISTETFFETGTSMAGKGLFKISNDCKVDTEMVVPGKLELNNGTLKSNNNKGKLTASFFDWIGGTDDLLTIIPSGGVLNLKGIDKVLANELDVQSNAVVNWDAGNISFSDGTFNNYGIFSTSFGGIMSGFFTRNHFNNYGVLRKTTNTTTVFGLDVNFLTNSSIAGIGIFNYTGTVSFTSITIGPGSSPGILTINKNPFSPASTYEAEIKDLTGPGTGHDELIVTTDVALGGTLKITELGTVPLGSYTILSSTGTITGTFNTVVMPPGYGIAYNSTSVVITKNAVTGILDIPGYKPIYVFPNPVNSFIHITGLPALGEKRVRLVDLSGNIFLNVKTTNSTQTIDISNKPAGVYLLGIKIAGKEKYLKIVKQ